MTTHDCTWQVWEDGKTWGSKLLMNDDKSTIIKSVECFKTLLNADRNLGPRALALINHKLAKLSLFKHNQGDPKVYLHLLELIPLCARDKACIAPIINIINLLGNNHAFEPVRLKLLYQLWKVEPRCYTFLEKNLLADTVMLPFRSRAEAHNCLFFAMKFLDDFVGDLL